MSYILSTYLYDIYKYCRGFFFKVPLNSYKTEAVTIEKLQTDIKHYKELIKTLSDTLIDTCDKYQELIKQHQILSNKILFYEEELHIVQTQLIKYMDDNLKLQDILANIKNNQ